MEQGFTQRALVTGITALTVRGTFQFNKTKYYELRIKRLQESLDRERDRLKRGRMRALDKL